jgi:hypothetical protein
MIFYIFLRILMETAFSISTHTIGTILNSPFCVQAKVIKLVGLKNGGRLSPTQLINFACTQNGE